MNAPRPSLSVAWVDGRLVRPDDPAVSAFDHALLTGDGVFETLRLYRSTPFALTRHLDRLRRSATALGLTCPPDAEVRAAIAAVIGAYGQPDGRVRVTLTGGPAPLGSQRGKHDHTLIVAAGPQAPWPPTTAVVRVPWPRNERSAVAGIKTVSYAENVVALAYAHERGAGEAIFGNTVGNLCEGTGSNVFVGIDGRLITPPRSSGCLGGIVRELVLEAGVADEADIRLADLEEADEVFITSSTREVQPVREVDGRALPQAPGPLTERAAAAFAEILAKTLDP